MCGIAGYYSWGGRPLEPGRIERMTKTLSHRGPDDIGLFEDGCVSLGHTRLSIIDLSSSGHQPMTSTNGALTITYNGEIYNYIELRETMSQSGMDFRTSTDTEVLLRQYATDGIDCLNKLNGMFAFGIWDSIERQMFLARDRAGQKPLFYYLGNDFIVFGSEIKTLFASGLVPAQLNHKAVATCLIYNASSTPDTGFVGIQQLNPGECIIANDDGVSIRRYWSLAERIAAADRSSRSESEWVDLFEDAFEQSVKLRMRSDAPFGAFLSGGMDSAAIVAAMRSARETPPNTFSYQFAEKTFDESTHASEIAALWGTNHHEIDLGEQPLNELLDHVIKHGEEYTPNPCFIPVYRLCQEAAKTVKVVLSGDGADEILAGYETYQASLFAGTYGHLPNRMKQFIGRLALGLKPSDQKVPLGEKLKRFTYGTSSEKSPYSHALWRYIFKPEELTSVFASDSAHMVQDYDPIWRYRDALDLASDQSLLTRLLHADFTYYLPNDALVKLDRMGMAHGVEIRSPFLDPQLVELCFSMPDNMKLKNRIRRKYVLRRYLEGRAPASVLQRKKAGFNVPVDQWLRGPLKERMTDELSQESIRRVGVFEPSTVSRLVASHLSGAANEGLRIWNLLTFMIWHRRFIEQANTPS